MIETKHTPLPWKAVSTPITWQVRSASDEVITESWDYHPLPDSNAQLIVTSVNARPQVEEALRVGEQVDWDGILARLNCVGLSEHYMEQLRQLRFKLRDVEAALKDSA